MSLDLPLLATLFGQFAVISLLAFGGGQAVLPLIERTSVAEHDWTTTAAFTSALGFGYLIPGPVTTLATFIGFQAAGFPGALAATLGMFLAPVLLAAGVAAGLERFTRSRWVRAFGAGATPAIVGLLAATFWHIARQTISSWALAGIALVGLLVTARTRVPPIGILVGGACLGLVAWLAHLDTHWHVR